MSDNSSKYSAEAEHAWHAAVNLLDLVDVVFSTISQLAVIGTVVRGRDGGVRLALLCLASPVFLVVRFRDLWSRG